jgi:hypothetical protein
VTVGAVFVVSGAGKSTNHESELASSKACHLPALDTFVYLTGMIELVGGLLPPRSRGSGVRRHGCSRADRPDCTVANLSDLTALPYQTVLGGLSATGGCDWGRFCWAAWSRPCRIWPSICCSGTLVPAGCGGDGKDGTGRWLPGARLSCGVAGVRARRPQRGASRVQPGRDADSVAFAPEHIRASSRKRGTSMPRLCSVRAPGRWAGLAAAGSRHIRRLPRRHPWPPGRGPVHAGRCWDCSASLRLWAGRPGFDGS